MIKISVSRADVFSPANAVSLIGLCMTVFGAFHIETLMGVLVLGLGRLLDVFDGRIARATHTSRLGAIVDATCDKLGLAILLPAVWISQIVPYWLILYIAVQNISNVVISLLSEVRGGEPESSLYGKHAMFIQSLSVAFFALGNTLDRNYLNTLGLLIGIASLYWAFMATYGYLKLLPRPRNTNDNK